MLLDGRTDWALAQELLRRVEGDFAPLSLCVCLKCVKVRFDQLADLLDTLYWWLLARAFVLNNFRGNRCPSLKRFEEIKE